jgi:glycosyltransferase involved in cell wall biosynthesis
VSRTKILYLISSLDQGGAERHLVDLVARLDPARFETEICVLRDELHFAGELPPGEPRHHLRARSWLAPRAFARLGSLLRAVRPAILHTYLNDANLWGRLAAMLAGRHLGGPQLRVVTSVHCDAMPAGYRALERRLAARSDRIVAHSRNIARLLLNDLGLAPGRVVTIPNGVDTQRFRPAGAAEAASARAALGLERDATVALMPARISPLKNQDLVVQAVATLRDAGALPEGFRLLLAGRVSSAGMARRLRGRIARSRLGDRVRLLGAVRDMPALYAAADVVLLPSRTEASPIAALEALAAGVPVLISAAANSDQVLVPGRDGWQIERPGADQIAAALRAILDTAPAERRRMGERGRAHVCERFTATRVAGDFTRLYDQLHPRASLMREPAPPSAA